MNNNIIITRFAPSPTGYLHIGNIRVAFYSWLYSRKYNGKFILRIEDTDVYKSNNKKYYDYIFYILEWLGLYWDEKPYYQSDRIDLYKSVIDYMLENNLAYKCYCTHERLNNIRNICIKNKIKPKYDRYCRNKSYKNKNTSYVVRFKNPLKGFTCFNDILFKKISINNIELDDIIIQRSNGLPTYNFCVVVDDYYMNISHIIRGQDHINNTPRQINIINSLNYNIPNYLHLPIILDINGKKLSKSNFSSNILNYINEGFIPDSILNYLFNLGRNNKENEIIDFHKMKFIFDFKYFNKSPCILDIKKIYWYNKYYICNLPYKKIFKNVFFFINNNNIYIDKIDNISEIITFISKKSSSIKEIVNFLLLFNKKINFNNLYLKKFVKRFSYLLLFYFYKILYKIKYWSINNLNNSISILINRFKKFSSRKIFKVLHFFLTGKEYGISIINILLYLKKNKSIYRIKYCIKKFFKLFIK